jgi:hypothetical protein
MCNRNLEKSFSLSGPLGCDGPALSMVVGLVLHLLQIEIVSLLPQRPRINDGFTARGAQIVLVDSLLNSLIQVSDLPVYLCDVFLASFASALAARRHEQCCENERCG